MASDRGLSEPMKTYCFDIDGTLCTDTGGEYDKARPDSQAIARLNALYDMGHTITLFTARGATTGIDWRELTEKQLRSWGVKYHRLLMGKPSADVYIDDKAENVRDWLDAAIPRSAAPSTTHESRGSQPVLATPAYLDVDYSPDRVPYGKYPLLLAQWLLRNVYKQPGRLLDIGSGRGEYLAAFHELGFETAGVDISPRAPELSEGARVEVADLERDPLPFPPESFDFVYSKSVIEHTRYPTRMLSRAIEALRPGGTAAILTPSWAHTYWGPFYLDHTHVTPFTAPSLEKALTQTGFTDVEVSNFYQLPFLWRYPFLKPVVLMVAALPLSYRPYKSAPWPDGLNKLIRFSKEVMLLGVGRKPGG